MQSPNQLELAKMFHVTASGTATWDGKEYDLSKGINIKLGVIQHWQGLYPDREFKMTEISEKPLGSKEVVNPLEANDRGEAFAGLKKRGRPAQGG